jgi:hypothetical protein
MAEDDLLKSIKGVWHGLRICIPYHALRNNVKENSQWGQPKLIVSFQEFDDAHRVVKSFSISRVTMKVIRPAILPHILLFVSIVLTFRRSC